MVALLLLLVAGHAEAQTSTVPHEPSFSVDRLTPAPGPGGFFQVEDATLLRDGSWGATAVSSLTSRPLVIRRLGGEDETLTEPVALRLGLDLGFAYGWRDRVQIGLALPVIAFQDGDRLQGLGLMEPGADASLAVAGIGDLRLHGKLALRAPRRGYGAGLALASVLTMPTGDDGDFAGEAGFTVELRGVASYRAPRWRAAANLGGRLRSDAAAPQVSS